MEEKIEKRTGKTGRFMGWMVSILIIATLACGFVAMYPRMTLEARKVYAEHMGRQRQESAEAYMEEVYYLAYGAYVEWYQQMFSTEKTPGEILLGPMKPEYEEKYAYLLWYEQSVSTWNNWYYDTYRSEREEYQIEYYIIKDMAESGYGALVPETAAEDTTKYPFYVELKFDASGVPTVVSQRGIPNAQKIAKEQYELWTSQNQILLDRMVTPEVYVYHGTNALQNMTVILASESRMYENFNDSVSITREALWQARWAMELDYTIFVLAALVVVLLLGLLLPAVRPLGLREGWKANIPLEILIVAAGAITLVLIDYVPEFVVKCQMELDYPGTVFYWLGIMEDIVAGGRITYVLLGASIALWFAVFFGIYLCVINVRQLFAKGIFRFMKENTLIGRICVRVFGWIKKVVLFCGDIDFSNKGTKIFVTAVVLNFFVIALFSCAWFFGILLAVPYSLLLFWLLQRKWNKIRMDYEILLSTTEEMARGVTDVEYIGDAGVFHELQGALADVQEGFHTAVQEEVKSQKMKTELITNVSHDLKTPLTAIITYVDLLKKEELTEQERRDYVAVLEQKSARLKFLIEDLFEISKATSGNIHLDKVNLDLVQLIRQVQMELEDEIMKSGIVFKVNLPEEKVMVYLDAQKTCRIFENLTMNVLKYGLCGSRAYINMEQTEKAVQVIYKNVSEAEINYTAEEIMERFTRGDDSRNTEGSGLGLAIVKSFAEAQGGKAKVELDDDLFKVIVTFPKTRIDTVQQSAEVVSVEASFPL